MRDTRTARELDLEASERRDRLASTLDELTASLTPGRVLDEVLSYAKGGGGNFLMGLGKSAAANPLPTLLVSTGCALFLSGRGGLNFMNNKVAPRRGDADTEWRRSIRGRETDAPGLVSRAVGAVSGVASAIADNVGSAAGSVAAVASDIGTRITDSAAGAASAVADTATSAGEGVASAGAMARDHAESAAGAVRETAASAQRRATLLGRELHGKAAAAFEDYPLAVAAGGLLVGAALAALLPRSRVEDCYVGETSDVIKGAFVEGAVDEVERLATGVENVVQAVSTKAGEEDLVGAAKGSIDEFTEKVGNTLKAGKDAINEELGSQARFPSS